MKKALLFTALLLAASITANAQGYTTLGIGIDSAQATLHVHSATPVSNGGGNPGGDMLVDTNMGIGPRSIDPIFETTTSRASR